MEALLKDVPLVLGDLFDSSADKQLQACKRLLDRLVQAWSTPVVGRDHAYTISDKIRQKDGLKRLVVLCKSSDARIQLAAVKALEQCLVPNNRDVLVALNLSPFIHLVYSKKADLVKSAVGILVSLFKHSAATCAHLIEEGGLDAVLYASRSRDTLVLRACASALANCAMYGSAKTQRDMIVRNTAEWLFPLAFSSDASVQYYACLAISVLASNDSKDIKRAITASGTLELVKPFVTCQDPVEFAKSDPAHCQGRSTNWLRRLVPILESTCKEARCLAVFHFVMEANIKNEQKRLQDFQEIGAIAPLQAVARTGTAVARSLAKRALLIMGHEVPKHLSLDLLTWQPVDIQLWLKEIGLSCYWPAFEKCCVDGELLATMTEDEMEKEIEISNRLHRRKLHREIMRLRSAADYSMQDTEGISEWLVGLGHEMAQYRGEFVRCGVTFRLLRHLTDEDLGGELKVVNSIHRKKLLLCIEEQFGNDAAEEHEHSWVPHHDVFISYRRPTGSQLASLLKVHLQLRGLSVFLDVDQLGAGKADEAVLERVGKSRTFVIVLTANALDSCLQDTYRQDSVHQELRAAVHHGCNIIPIVEDSFEWPARQRLPEDIRCVTSFNAVSWSHEYQEAAIEKVANFINLPEARKSSVSAGSATHIHSLRFSRQFSATSLPDRASPDRKISRESRETLKNVTNT